MLIPLIQKRKELKWKTYFRNSWNHFLIPCKELKKVLNSSPLLFLFLWGIELVSPNKNHKIPEYNLYGLHFKTYLDIVSTYLQLTANFIKVRYFYKSLHISCPKKASFHRFWLKFMTGFRAPIRPLLSTE